MKNSLIYNKLLFVKLYTNILYLVCLPYTKNLFIMYSLVYKHSIWNYKKNVTERN